MLQSFMELREIHGLLDQSETWLVKQTGVPVCIDNCGRCCEENTVSIHSIEASYIISYLLGQGKLDVIDWCRGWLLEKHSQATTYEGMPRGLVREKLMYEWNALQRLPCILLTPDKRCLIHKSRPLPCRAYGVTRVPAIYCPRPMGKGEAEGGRAYVGNEPAKILIKETHEFIERVKKRNPDWIQMSFLPTMIFRQAREQEFRTLIADNKIASAKLVGTSYSVQSLFQYQIDLEWLNMKKEPVNLIKA